MEAAKNSLERIITAVDNLSHLAEAAEPGKEDETVKTAVDEYVLKFEAAMDDDFNTADAIAAVFELVKYANTNITSEQSQETILMVKEKIVNLCDVMGIITEVEKEILAEEIEKLIEERQAARKAKNFARADEIRDQLLSQGIILEDTREGVKWKKA